MINKKVILFIVLVFSVAASNSAIAQENSIGIKGGYGFGMANIEPRPFLKMAQGFYNAGVVFSHRGIKKSVDSWQVELIYAQRGYTTLLSEKSEFATTRVFNSIELPLLWKPNYSFAKDRVNIYGVIGPYLFYDVSSYEKYRDTKNPNSDYNRDEKWEYNSLRDNRIGYGVIAGGGLGYNISKSIQIAVEVRYIYAFSSVFRPASKYVGNPIQSTTSQITASLGIYYKFHRKDGKNK